ncbi:hypothetical protein, partial [Dorea sp.]
MEKDKRKKALQVACTVFVFVCVIFAMYKLTKLDDKNAIQRQKQEETQEKEDKINAKCEAIEYMDEYTENLQEQMRKAGIGDEYYGAAEPPVRCGESHLSGLTEPPQFVYLVTLPLLDPVHILL